MRLTGIASSNAIEVGLGSLWNEDPRYTRAGEGDIWSRVVTLQDDLPGEPGRWVHASRVCPLGGIAGSNFLSNTWRVESESTTGAALQRTGLGFAGTFVGNVFGEFWPDLNRKVFHRK